MEQALAMLCLGVYGFVQACMANAMDVQPAAPNSTIVFDAPLGPERPIAALGMDAAVIKTQTCIRSRIFNLEEVWVAGGSCIAALADSDFEHHSLYRGAVEI
jgi:hypothetical protein